MADTKTIKNAFERNVKLLNLKPEKGQYTTSTKIRLKNGTTCDVEHKDWTFKADVGENQGGNNAGPGPSVLQRGALGSCLAIGYATWAAAMGVPIENIEVIVEADVDARGTYGIEGVKAGYKALRYTVSIESPAPKEKILDVIEKADNHSPVLMDFKKPVPVERNVQINKRSKIPT